MKPDAMKPALFRVHNFRYSNRVRLVDSSKDAHRFVLLKIEKSKITLFHSSLLQPPRHNGRRFQLTGLAGAKNSPLAMYQQKEAVCTVILRYQQRLYVFCNKSYMRNQAGRVSQYWLKCPFLTGKKKEKDYYFNISSKASHFRLGIASTYI